MHNLKTTPEERAAARAQSSGIPGFGSTVAAHMADDVDTLLAEVERLRAGVAAIRRIEAAFAPVSMVEACRSMNAISTVLGPLEAK